MFEAQPNLAGDSSVRRGASINSAPYHNKSLEEAMNSTLKLHHLVLRLCAVLVCALAVSQGIQASTPRLDVISPTRVDAGATNVTVTLSGTSFANDDKVFV